MMSAGGTMKSALGLMLVLIGVALGHGLDNAIEATLVAVSPDWLTSLTTRF